MSAAKTARLGETKVLPIGEVKPYWRNPRRIPQEAVDAVAKSIEDYGYQQPIVVDPDNVIIVGHTRLQALMKLGYREVSVQVADLDEEKAREYRLIDNKTSEMTSWDQNALILELREFDKGLLATYFPDVDLEIDMADSVKAINQSDIDWQQEKIKAVTEAIPLVTVDVTCPACFHTFPVKATALPGVTKEDAARLIAETSESA